MESIRTCGLFEGIGGFPRAAELIGGFDWRISVEHDQDAIAVLQSNFNHRIFGRDIREFHVSPGEYDLIVGGFPCTNTSGAGDRTGIADLSSASGAMFREFLRVIGEARPKLILLEQPAGFEHRGLRAWVGGLRMGGYQSLDPIFTSADELGANFQRERLFILSDSLSWSRGKTSGCWPDRVREVVEETRNSSHWLTVEQRSDRIAARIPSQLVSEYQPSISCDTRHPGRLTSRKLGGQTVTVPQARVALECVKWLWGEISSSS